MRLGYNEKTAPITGFARWDVLKDKQSDKEKFILLMPTWRSWLEEVSDNQFLASDYYNKYLHFFKAQGLIKFLKIQILVLFSIFTLNLRAILIILKPLSAAG